MKKPARTIKTDTLGDLKFDGVLSGKHAQYIAGTDFEGERIELVLYTDEESGELDPTIEFATRLIKDGKEVKRSLDAYIATSVLKSVNRFLRADNPLSAPDISRHLRVVTINVHADGRASFWYNAGELFLGHGLVLRGTSDGKIKDFDTPG